MKVHDIISEATPGLGTAIKAGVNAFKAARTGAPAVAQAATTAVKKATATGIKSLDDIVKMAPEKLAKIPKDTLEPWGKAAADAKNYKAMDKIANVLGKDTRNLYQKVAPNLIGGKTIAPEVLAGQALKNSSLAGKSGDVVKLATTLGLATETYTYWRDSSELDNKLAAGMPQEEYNKQLQELRGKFITGVIAPWAAMTILKYPAKLLKIVPGTMKLVGFPNAAEITSILAKRGSQLALLAWFNGLDGKEWLNNLMGGTLFGTLGNIPKMAGEITTALSAAARVATGIGLPKEFEPSSTEIGGGKNGYIDPFKGTDREGGI
jgi:hypothetical protein